MGRGKEKDRRRGKEKAVGEGANKNKINWHLYMKML